MMRGIFKAVAGIVPKKYRKSSEVYLNYAGVDEEVDTWLGARVVVCILFAIIGALIPNFLQSNGIALLNLDQSALLYVSLAAGVLTLFLTAMVFYSHLSYVIDERRKRVEAILPDFLLLIAANLRAGMTPVSAFVEASMPEFGPLEDEVEIVASRSMGTEPFAMVFGRLGERIDSRVLKRVVGLFTTGMVSGGHLARLLETSALDIRETQDLKQELASSTRMYVIFVLFIVLIGIPLLLSISIQFLIKLIALKSQISESSFTEINSSLFSVGASLDPQFVEEMTYVILIGTTLSVSILIGVISEGKLLYGLRYFVPLVIVSVIDFIICKGIVEGILVSLA